MQNGGGTQVPTLSLPSLSRASLKDMSRRMSPDWVAAAAAPVKKAAAFRPVDGEE